MLESQVPRLVQLLLDAGRDHDALALLAQPRWLTLRIGQYGFAPFVEDARRILAAAATRDRDDDVVRILLRVEKAGLAFRTAWEDGSAARAIVAANSPMQVRGVLHALGSSGAPWAGLLAMVKLLDLHALSEAAELLRTITEENWPGYQPKGMADGLAGWSDFVTDPLVLVLTRALEASPAHAARLARRLYEDQRPTIVPNSHSVWAQLLEKLVSSQAPAQRIVAAAEHVRLTILPESNALVGLIDRLCEARHRAIEAVASEADATWLWQEYRSTLELFGRLPGEAEKREGTPTRLYGQLASLLLLLARLEERVRDPALKARMRKDIADALKVAPIPEPPATHDYGNRSFVLARYSVALDAIGHPRSAEAVESTLAACELDARCNDPPLEWVRKALDALEAIGRDPVRMRTRTVRQALDGLLERTRVDVDSPWAPSLESSDPLEYGLALLAAGSGAAAAPFCAPREPRPTKTKDRRESFRDQVLRALIHAWSHVADPGVIERASRLDALRSNASGYSISLSAVVRTAAWRMKDESAAIALLETATRKAIAEDDINAAASLIADLAPRGPGEAIRLFDELAPAHPSDRGGVITLILMNVLGSQRADPAAIQRLVERLPRQAGPPLQFELNLLAEETKHPELKSVALSVVDRCIAQLESDIDDALPVNDEEATPTIDEVEKRVARIARLIAACAAARSLGNARPGFVRLLERVHARMRKPSTWHTTRNVLLKTMTDSWRSVRVAEAADFYVDVLGTPERSRLFPAAIGDLGGWLSLASSIFDIAPHEARALADAAFDRAGEWLADAVELDHLGRSANLLIEALARESGAPREVRDALEFVEAAQRWSLSEGVAKVAVRMETLSGRASDARVRDVLSGATAKLWLKARETTRADGYVRTAPFETLEALELLSAMPGGSAHRAWSRGIVVDRLGQLLGGLKSDADWLGKLLILGIDSLSVEQATLRLEAVENALSDECETLRVAESAARS